MHWHSKIAQERINNNGMQRGFSKKNEFTSLTTSRKKVVEQYSLLRHDVLISSGGDDRLKKSVLSLKKRKEILGQVSSYIDQSENFYNYAIDSDYRSSALLYYYAFLNLAKAAILINNPDLLNRKFVHGVHAGSRKGALVRRSIVIQNSSQKAISVYNELYKLQYEKNLRHNKSITISSILGYISDIRVETTRMIGRDVNKIHKCKFYVLANTNTRKCWVVLATENGFYPANYPKSYASFQRKFERFNPSMESLYFNYEIPELEQRNWSFSHSKQELDLDEHNRYPLVELYKIVESVFKNKIEDELFDADASFLIEDPIDKAGKVNFNETMSIYSLMFYLSHIVRYYPDEFDKNFAQTTTDGWLVKNFVEVAPYVALNHLSGLISGKKYRLLER